MAGDSLQCLGATNIGQDEQSRRRVDGRRLPGIVTALAFTPAGGLLSGSQDHTLRLWQLVVFEKWHQLYVDRDGSSSSAESLSVMPFSPRPRE